MTTETIQHDDNISRPPAETCQFVTFFLSDREFGVDIQSVREIKGWQPTTALPNTPASAVSTSPSVAQISLCSR